MTQEEFALYLDRQRELDRFDDQPRVKKVWDDEDDPVISRSSQLSLDLDLKSVRANEAWEAA
jgi:hypothetical protein